MSGPNLARAALWYGRHGWRIHPLKPASKHPILKGWPEKASADPAIISAWWSEFPGANIGCLTGPPNGFFVLDVDHPNGDSSLAALEREHGPLPEWPMCQFTGGGGSQIFYSWPEGRLIQSRAGKLGADLDIRGLGGSVVLPPSVHPSGTLYRWGEDRSPAQLKPCAAPDWLLDLIETKPMPERSAWQAPHQTGPDRFALKALEAELSMVAAAPAGRRNEQLNASGHALFRFVAQRRLPVDVIQRGLIAAGRHAGLSDAEIMPTIKSAAKARGVSP